jgi:hypothetical protein
MATLDNSTRRLHQAVYARVKVGGTQGLFTAARPFLKWGLVAAGRPTAAEIAQVRKGLTDGTAATQPGGQSATDLAALATIEALSSARGQPDLARIAPLMADVDASTLLRLAESFIKSRQQRIESTIASLERVASAWETAQSLPPAAELLPPQGFEVVTEALPHLPAATLLKREEVSSPPSLPPAPGTRPLSIQGTSQTTEFVLMQPAPALASPPASRATTSVQTIAQWARRSGQPAAELDEILNLAQQYAYDPAALMAADYAAALDHQVDHAVSVLNAFKSQIAIEPIGFLHLERLTFAPDGIERGELVYSVPLSPGEEVNIAHKEWTTTAEEFQTIVTDTLEEYSEKGVTEKSELSQSSTSEQQHSNGFNTGVTASGGYGPVSITSTVGVSIQDSASSTQEFSRNHSIATTRKASTRSTKEHKMSFKVASAAGTEDKTVRKIKNPYPDKATRVDYYQLIRKWEVNVYRYGIRLTYDITIPEPGSDLLTTIVTINELNAALQEGFGGSSKLPWARFDLKPTAITRKNYTDLAARYNATVPSPPQERKHYDKVASHDWKSIDEASENQYWTLDVDVDEDYEIDSAKVDSSKTHYFDVPWHLNIQSVADFIGTSGKRTLVYATKYLGSVYIELRVRAKLKDPVFQDWQLKAWNAMRDSAQARYYEHRAMLESRLAALTDALGAQDALSLRKFEREEVMKGAIRWLFGPDFEFVPKGLPSDLYAKDESIASKKRWKEVLAHGELITFLHHAVEWENVLYFLYPYFWSHVSRWDLKKHLHHPDPMHRAFLRAGSARVVLTIRPGFERDFVSLLETGLLGALPKNHPYLSIIEEMEAFAKTNYPGIPPANPEETAMKEEGVKIGTWYEYTPTSALDISFGETLPSA